MVENGGVMGKVRFHRRQREGVTRHGNVKVGGKAGGRKERGGEEGDKRRGGGGGAESEG